MATNSQGAPGWRVLQRRVPHAVSNVTDELGEVSVYIPREHLIEAVTVLRDDPDALYLLPVHVTAVDWPEREPRFDVVYQLRSLHHNDCIRLIVQVSDEDPTVPSLETVYAGMDWHERETYDLFGIIFDNHHDLQRILLPNDWVGHPLRKDYISFGEPVAFTHNLEWALPAQERPSDMPGRDR